MPPLPKLTVSILFSSKRTVMVSTGIFSDGSRIGSNFMARRFDIFASRSSTLALSTVLPAAFFQTSFPSAALLFSRARVEHLLADEVVEILGEVLGNGFFHREDHRAGHVLRIQAVVALLADDDR